MAILKKSAGTDIKGSIEQGEKDLNTLKDILNGNMAKHGEFEDVMASIKGILQMINLKEIYQYEFSLTCKNLDPLVPPINVELENYGESTPVLEELLFTNLKVLVRKVEKIDKLDILELTPDNMRTFQEATTYIESRKFLSGGK